MIGQSAGDGLCDLWLTDRLYKALSKDGNPNFGTVLKVLHALGLKITLQPI